MNVHAQQPPIGQLVWRKSRYSSEEGGECIEVAARPGEVHVRDSKDTTRAALTVHPAAWTAFVGFAVA